MSVLGIGNGCGAVLLNATSILARTWASGCNSAMQTQEVHLDGEASLSQTKGALQTYSMEQEFCLTIDLFTIPLV